MIKFKPQILAFYLPQYYPTKENNEWYGVGFTEWTNVAKAKPCFKGHVQPKIPADLGFYDLRSAEVREKQAIMARDAGVTAFCYYDYWFGDGSVMLEKPLEAVLSLKKPDFPFCLCWANHSWYKKDWNPSVGKLEQTLLKEQKYSGKNDYLAHFNRLLPAFKDSRYYKINGRNVYMILGLNDFEDFNLFKNIWNQQAIENGLNEFYFLSYTSEISIARSERFLQTEGTAISLLYNNKYNQNYSLLNRIKVRFKTEISKLLNYPLYAIPYKKAIERLLDPVLRENRLIPVVFPNWDYTARRGNSDIIFYNSTPELFKRHIRQAFELIKDKPLENQLIFLKSWNEWGEGNYMEPDLEYGHGRLNALKEVIEECTYEFNQNG